MASMKDAPGTIFPMELCFRPAYPSIHPPPIQLGTPTTKDSEENSKINSSSLSGIGEVAQFSVLIESRFYTMEPDLISKEILLDFIL